MPVARDIAMISSARLRAFMSTIFGDKRPQIERRMSTNQSHKLSRIKGHL